MKARNLWIAASLLAVLSVGVVTALSSPQTLLSDHPFFKALMEKLQTSQDQNRPEKVYVHLDKTLYKEGETIWLSAYIRDAQNLRASETSGIVYVELVNPKGSVDKKITLIAQNGQAAGDFLLPANLKGGLYKVRAYTQWQQNFDEVFEREIQIQKVVLPNLNMKLDFERDAYGPGATATARLDLNSLDKQALANHNFEYVLSLDGNEWKKGTGKTDGKGSAMISFDLPKDLKTNDALINVMFEYKGQTESISRSVPIVLGKIDLQFFPEGGELLANMQTAVAFKALDEFGKAADVEGEVVDELGKSVSKFRSYHQGMGKFEFRPIAGKKYFARITQPAFVKGNYALPATKDQGVSLRVRGQTKQQIQLDVLTTTNEELYVVVQAHNNIVFSQVLQAYQGVNSLSIPTASFPVGITQITVFDSKQVPRSERMVFVNQHKKLRIKVKTNKEKYLPRELVEMSLEVTDERGNPVSGQFSMAVVDDKLLTYKDDKQGHVLAYALLESDLKGKIEEPNFYFDDESDANRPKPEVEREIALDNLLMTQGWRRFVWKEVLEGKKVDMAKANEPAVLAGKVVDKAGNPVEGADVTVAGAIPTKTDKEGQFVVRGAMLYQAVALQVTGAEIMSYAQNFAEYNNNIKIAVDKKKVISGVVRTKMTKDPIQYAVIYAKGPGIYQAVQTDAKGAYKIEFPEGATQLIASYGGYDPVVIDLTTNRNVVIDFAFVLKSPVLEEFTDMVITNSHSTRSGNVPQLNSAVGKGNAKTKSASPPPPPAPSIRDMKLPKKMDAPEIFDAEPMEDIRVVDMPIAEPAFAEKAEGRKEDEKAQKVQNEVDLGFNLDDANFEEEIREVPADRKAKDKEIVAGKEMAAGRARSNVANKRVAVAAVRYYRAREFYSPQYTDKVQPAVRSDFRSTVYWNPAINVGNDGKANLKFYNSDDITQFRITVEGFGNAGQVGRVEQKFFTQLPVELLTKIPAEVLTGDKVFIPVTITNNTNESLDGQFLVTLPKHIRLIQAVPATLKLAANSAQTIFVQGEVLNEVSTGNMTIAFETKGLRDQVSAMVEARPRGFPVRALYSGDKLTQSFRLEVKDPIEGTLRILMRLFPSTLDQVMGGMEAMLRMPGGCFEQTSSSNYPNVLALSYMREMGLTNAALEKKVQDYLNVGYGRLTGYESKGGGFDWWGRDPAHEALTAYGLMQFVDMKTVYPVDDKLIDRTSKWLMGRKDGNGGWKLNSNCLHSWATSEITHAYIVWSLTEAGYGKDVAKELDKSYKDAIKSEDPYLMALVTNALLNMNDKRSAELMKELVKTQQKDGSFVGLTASVTNSRGKALMIETTGLAALAMLKAKTNNKELGMAVATLQGGKDYYGYGSTQGTVLALKAILGYTKQNKRTAEDGVMAVYVNGKKVQSVAYTAGQKEIMVPELTSFFSNGDNKVEVKFEGVKEAVPFEMEMSYNTRMPDNSDKCNLALKTTLPKNNVKMGETVRLNAEIKNNGKELQPMTMAMIGVPAGLSVQLWQLKELQDKKVFDYYEMFNGYIVLHYEALKPGETKSINFDLKADVPGEYEAPASCAFLYYTNEHRVWSKPERMTIN